MAESDGRPPFDEERARSFIGKSVFIGMSYEDTEGRPLGQHQLHGRVVAANAKEGICVRLEGMRAGKYTWLPPDLRPWQDLPRGEYRLRSTGEILTNPDLQCFWIATRHDGKMPPVPEGLLDPVPPAAPPP